MLGIIVLLLLTIVIHYFLLDKKLNIEYFKLSTSQFRILIFCILFVLIVRLLLFGLSLYLSSSKILINPNFEWKLFWISFWFDIRSVLTEELVFRGVIFWLLLLKYGARPAVLISTIAFIIYHWFSYGIYGVLMPMLVVSICIGIMGWAMGLSMVKSGSIYFPIIIHFTWNFTQNTILSNGPLGEVFLLYKMGELKFSEDMVGLILLLASNLIVPLFILLYVHKFIPQKKS